MFLVTLAGMERCQLKMLLRGCKRIFYLHLKKKKFWETPLKITIYAINCFGVEQLRNGEKCDFTLIFLSANTTECWCLLPLSIIRSTGLDFGNKRAAGPYVTWDEWTGAELLVPVRPGQKPSSPRSVFASLLLPPTMFSNWRPFLLLRAFERLCWCVLKWQWNTYRSKCLQAEVPRPDQTVILLLPFKAIFSNFRESYYQLFIP